jgi:hypothetical protein
VERKRIPKEYYRDTKCETIEGVMREDPRFIDWKIMRFRSSGELSDYEDSFEIQNAKGRAIITLSESEIDLLISNDTLMSVLDTLQRLGVFQRLVSYRGVGHRAFNAVIILSLVSLFALLIPFLIYIMSLPMEQALPGFASISMLYMFFIVILILMYEKPYGNEDYGLERLIELADLKQNDPKEYIRRLREVIDEQNQSSLEQER